MKKELELEGIRADTYLKNILSEGEGLNKDSPYWLDIEVFERGINEIVIRPFQTVEEVHLVALNKVLELYKGDLLEGVYSDWALRERERLRTLFLKNLIYLLQFHGFRGAYERAIAFGQQILALDPLREEIHRELIRLYWKNGQRALAVRQYETCRSTLAKELGLAPLEDTQRLYTQIVTGTGDSDSTIVSGNEIGIEEALRQLREANQAIEFAKGQLQRALQLIIKLSDPSE